ncbi:MAG: ATP-binding protein [Mariprofundus sp.]|nr:ATP-binding protein [Mariprofundus sp.]
MVAVMTARAGMAELQSNRVAIAVDELFANIAAHAYNGKQGRVEFETCIGNSGDGGQELIFNFRDYASAAWNGKIEEVTTAGTEVHDPLSPGGLGLRLICSVADRCEHEVYADGNHWRLIFKINDKDQLKDGK